MRRLQQDWRRHHRPATGLHHQTSPNQRGDCQEGVPGQVRGLRQIEMDTSWLELKAFEENGMGIPSQESSPCIRKISVQNDAAGKLEPFVTAIFL